MITPLLLTMSLAPQQPPQGASGLAARATNELGFALYRALDQERPGRNLFLSPFSITVTIAMLGEGAREETAAELVRAMHLEPGRDLASLHGDFQALLARYRDGGTTDPQLRQQVAALRQRLAATNAEAETRLRADDWRQARALGDQAHALARQINALLPRLDRYELRTANALWAERSFPLVPTFVDTLDRFYGTRGVNSLDIRNDADAARRRINAWVEEHTERRIQELIPRGGISADTALVISNAVFFRGEWADPFEAHQTSDGDFLLAGGARAKVRLMHDGWRAAVPYAAFRGDGSFFPTPTEVPADAARRPPTYPGDDGFTMIELPYKGGELAMVVIAPRAPDGLPRLEAMLNPTSLASWLMRLERRTVDTTMLRFEQRQGAELSGALQRAGVRRAFADPRQPGGAQFAGIAADRDPARQLFVGQVHHQAWLQVDEKGTEAAAATSIAMAVGAAIEDLPMEPFRPVFRADRPFVFVIRDGRSGAILFLGRVTAPQA